eukprot:4844319-Pyramimonas_sp.AAC.1
MQHDVLEDNKTQHLEGECQSSAAALQEITVEPSEQQERGQTLRGPGWNVSLSPSIVTDAGGLSLGAAAACQKFIGMGAPPTAARDLPAPH